MITVHQCRKEQKKVVDEKKHMLERASFQVVPTGVRKNENHGKRGEAFVVNSQDDISITDKTYFPWKMTM